MAGEQKDKPFGYIKAVKRGEEFILSLYVYPIDF